MLTLWVLVLILLHGTCAYDDVHKSPAMTHRFLIDSENNNNYSIGYLSLDNRLELGIQQVNLNASTTDCSVYAADHQVSERISQLVAQQTKLLKFDFTIEGYNSNPLLENMLIAYKGNQWTLATSTEGKTILTLAFDYGALSMMTLEFGVEQMDVVLKDEPKGCLGNLTEPQKVEVMTLAGMRHYSEPSSSVAVQPSESLCHQVIQKRWGFAIFTYQCCHLVQDTHTAQCHINEGNSWITTVDILLLSIRVIALFTVVTEILAIVVKRSMVHVPYVVKRDQLLKISLKILRVKPGSPVSIHQGSHHYPNLAASEETLTLQEIKRKRDSRQYPLNDVDDLGYPHARFVVHSENDRAIVKCGMVIDLRQEMGFYQCKKFVEKQGKEENEAYLYGVSDKIDVEMDRLHFAVDYDRLQEEDDVPVGFFRSLFTSLFICGLQRSDTFRQCCKTPLFKSCSRSPNLRWIHIFKPIGKLLLVFLIPAVFYVRIVFFYIFEEDEVTYRAGRARLVGLALSPNKFNLIDYVKPTDPLFIVIYALYLSTILLVGYLCASGDKTKFTNIVNTTFMDIQQTPPSRILLHFIKTLTVPFTMHGVLGCCIFPFYLVFMVPSIFILHVFYMVPLVYFTDRILSNSSKQLWPNKSDSLKLKKKCLATRPRHFQGLTYKQAFSEMMPHQAAKEMREREFHMLGSIKKYEKPKQISCMRKLARIIAILIITLTMYGMSLLAAECVGFLGEVITFTLMGIMVNAGVYLKFVSLGILIFVYARSCFRGVHKKYMKLNKSLFQSIKWLMKYDIEEVTAQEAQYQENTAFKAESVKDHLGRAETAKAKVRDKSEESQISENELDQEESPLLGDTEQIDDNINIAPQTADDSIVPKRHWLLNDVILFIDKHDTPRIPKLLFDEVCNVEVDGSPGPVHESMFTSLKSLFTMVFFLAFIFILISSFGAMYNVSSTNQMLATLVGGLLPLLLRNFMSPPQDNMELNSVSFQNKLNQIMKNIQQRWPIYDLELTKTKLVEEGEKQGDEENELSDESPITDSLSGAETNENNTNVNGLSKTGETNSSDMAHHQIPKDLTSIEISSGRKAKIESILLQPITSNSKPSLRDNSMISSETEVRQDEIVHLLLITTDKPNKTTEHEEV